MTSNKKWDPTDTTRKLAFRGSAFFNMEGLTKIQHQGHDFTNMNIMFYPSAFEF